MKCMAKSSIAPDPTLCRPAQDTIQSRTKHAQACVAQLLDRSLFLETNIYNRSATITRTFGGVLASSGRSHILSIQNAKLMARFRRVWWAFFVFLTILGTSAWQSLSSQNGALAVPREVANKARLPTDDEESRGPADATGTASNLSLDIVDEKNANERLNENKSVFTWKNLNYTVSTSGGRRQLLDDVHGWVKPGQLGALMGSSGAGKTTLMDVLAQRKTDGTITGSVLVDGSPLPLNFQRSAGYCEQLDVHEPLA